jgi:hypothetical protein
MQRIDILKNNLITTKPEKLSTMVFTKGGQTDKPS